MPISPLVLLKRSNLVSHIDLGYLIIFLLLLFSSFWYPLYISHQNRFKRRILKCQIHLQPIFMQIHPVNYSTPWIHPSIQILSHQISKAAPYDTPHRPSLLHWPCSFGEEKPSCQAFYPHYVTLAETNILLLVDTQPFPFELQRVPVTLAKSIVLRNCVMRFPLLYFRSWFWLINTWRMAFWWNWKRPLQVEKLKVFEG